MLTLTKLAGYDQYNLEDKVAEAMDYMESHGIDAIGGLTLLANTDANLNIVDEKVAAIAEAELNPEQANVLAEVAEYLGGVDEKVASIALEISANAENLIEKVAEYAAYVEEAGMPFEDAMILASASTEDGVDEKVANEAIAVGYTDEHLEFSEKVAQAMYEDLGITPDEALVIAKEAASIKGFVDSAVKKSKEIYEGDLKNMGKRAWGSYKAAITGKGADKVKKRIESTKAIREKAIQRANEEREKGKKAYDDMVGMGKSNPKKASALGSKAQYRHEQEAKKHTAAAKRLEESTKKAEKSLKSIKRRQAYAIGGTAAGAGTLGYGAYRGLTGRKDER